MKLVAALFTLGLSCLFSVLPLVTAIYHCIFRRSSIRDSRGEKCAKNGIQHPKSCVPSDLSHEYLDCNGVQLHVARAGCEHGREFILFLHGFPDSKYEVAAPDLPGYNASDKLENVADYTGEKICLVLSALLDKLNHKRCIIVGHDFGSALASQFAAMFPSRVSKLVLLAVPPPQQFRNADFRQFLASYYFYTFLMPHLPEFMFRINDYKVIKSMFTGKTFGMRRKIVSLEETEHYKDAFATPGAATEALNYYRAAMWNSAVLGENKLMKKALKLNPQHSMPVLIVMADHDRALFPNLLCNIGKVAPTAIVRILPNCSHWIQQDAADELNKLMELFFQSSDVL